MSRETHELRADLYEEIQDLCRSGDEFAEKGEFEAAVAEYNLAWKLIPEPKDEWEASTWVLGAIADACFFLGKDISARKALEFALTCPGGLGNPFLHLRLGQILYRADELDRAADELMRAYMGGGEKLFEAEDARYLAFLRSRADI